MTRESGTTKMLRYVYILEVDNRGKKSGYFGAQKLYYTGQTNNLWRRLNEHLAGRNSKFLSMNFRDAQKRLVFVKQIYGVEGDAIREEYRIKPMSRERKKKMIEDTDKNDLVAYVPFSHVILRSFEDRACQIPLFATERNN